ncbi:MAG: hypothetical protein QXS37_02600 [Candidatus Aenigmatarchaeota archaeon]
MDKIKILQILVVIIIVFFIIEMFSWFGRASPRMNVVLYNASGIAIGKIVNYKPFLIVKYNEKNENITKNLLENGDINYYNVVGENIKLFMKKENVQDIRNHFDYATTEAIVAFKEASFFVNMTTEKLSLDPVSIYTDPVNFGEEIDFEVIATIEEVSGVKRVRNVISMNPIPKEEVKKVNGSMNCYDLIFEGKINWKERYSKNFTEGNYTISDKVEFDPIPPKEIEKIKMELNESGIEINEITTEYLITNSTDEEKIRSVFEKNNRSVNFTYSSHYFESQIQTNNLKVEVEKLKLRLNVSQYSSYSIKGKCKVKIYFEDIYPKEFEEGGIFEEEKLHENFKGTVKVEKIGKTLSSVDLGSLSIESIESIESVGK